VLKAITFDFWDTLYKAPDSMSMSSRRIAAFAKTLRAAGHETEEENIRQAFYDCWQYANRYQTECGLDITPRGHVKFILAQLHLNLTPENWKRVYDVYTSILIDFPPQVNDGVEETLPQLAQKYKLAVICNTGVTPGIILREIMKKDDIFRYFAFAVFSDEVLWAKPNIKIFNYTLEKLRVLNSEAAHIGDNSSTDVDGAKRAGMTAIWLAPLAVEKIPECDFHVRSIKELVALLVE